MSDDPLRDIALSSLQVPVAIADWPGGDIRYRNNRFATLFSGAEGSADLRGCIGGVDWKAAEEDLGRTGAHVADVETRHDGREHHVRLQFRTMDEGQRLFVEGSDISNLREAEYLLDSYSRLAEKNARDLQREKDRTSQLFEEFTRNAPIGMYVKDGSGRYVMVNPRMEALFEKDASEILGKTVRDMLPPDEAAMVEAFDREILATRRTAAVVEKLESVGLFEWTLVVRFPIEAQDDPDMIGGFDIDITPQKRAEEELAMSRERLNQAERMTALGSLLAGVSHELNNPLAIVVGEATLMEEDAEGTGLAESATRIRIAAERCAKIVQSFLAIARQKPSKRERLDLNSVVGAVVELTGYQTRSNEIEIEQDLADELPAIIGDIDQLQQVVMNLLINAQQALQTRQPPRRIRISSFRKGDDIALRVADNGPGIASDLAKRIFDPFFTTKPEGTGTGIGLSYSQGVIEAHGGTLEVEPCEDGASFIVRLPVGRGGAVLAAPAKAAPSSSKSTARGRALVIDDEPDLANAIARLLQRLGFATDTAGNGNEAVAKLEAEDYELILSDLRMPGMDGAAFFAWLGEHRPDLLARTAFLTGDTLSPAAVTFLEQAGRPYLSKPLTREELSALVDELCSGGDSQ